MKIYLTRHGETIWNKEGKLQGSMDSPLTELGIRQADWLGKSLQDKNISCIISSSSGRAVDTAKVINTYLKCEIDIRDDLKEIYLGDWEGLDRDYLEYDDDYFNFWHHPERYEAHDKESYSELIERAGNALNDIIMKYDQDILIVTHGVLLRAIITYINKSPLKDFWNGVFMKSTCLNILEVSEGSRIFTLLGDISHYEAT